MEKTGPMKVLIADDDASTRIAVSRLVRKWGYEDIPVSDGNQAWKLLGADNPPRIAVLDWMMPGREGVEICRLLQEKPGDLFIYAILLTSKRETPDLVYALDNGAHDFVTKPVHPEELRSRIAVGRRLVESEDKLLRYAHEMERLAQERERLMMVDPLTEAGNRRNAERHLVDNMARFQRKGEVFGILLLDVDNFKNLNDTRGHAAGDAVLIGLVNTLNNSVRTYDRVFRWGGEEFIVLLPNIKPEEVVKMGNRICTAVSGTPVEIDGQLLTITVSMGATYVRPTDIVDTLLTRADRLMYESKKSGKNRSTAG